MGNPYDWGISKALCIMRERKPCLELHKTFLKLSYQTLAVQTHLTMKVRVVTSSSMNSYVHEDWAHISEGPFPATSLAACTLLFSSAPTLLGAPHPPHTHTPPTPRPTVSPWPQSLLQCLAGSLNTYAVSSLGASVQGPAASSDLFPGSDHTQLCPTYLGGSFKLIVSKIKLVLISLKPELPPHMLPCDKDGAPRVSRAGAAAPAPHSPLRTHIMGPLASERSLEAVPLRPHVHSPKTSTHPACGSEQVQILQQTNPARFLPGE